MNSGAERTFAARVNDFIQNIDYRIAESDEDREAIYRLRYDAYLREGAIEANRQRRFKDRYDDLPNVWIFGVYLNNRLASSMRIHIASNLHPQSPAMEIFPDLLQPRINAGDIVSDPTRFVADPDLARSNPYLPYATVRLAGLACDYFGVDLGLATVRAEHRPFYKRLFALSEMSEPRAYPGLKKPIVMMGADCRKVRSKILARYPFLTAPAIELESFFGGSAQRRVAASTPAPAPAMHIDMSEFARPALTPRGDN